MSDNQIVLENKEEKNSNLKTNATATKKES